MTCVAVIGATGFIGRHVAQAMSARGADVVSVPAPRLTTKARSLPGIRAELESPEIRSVVRRLTASLGTCDVVINAAGIADATGAGDAVFGADALLPGVVALAAPEEARVIHVSSAAVQGRRPVLDESAEYSPFSDYSTAKALGEQVAHVVRPTSVLFRPTSVQGAERRVTRQLSKIASSPLSTVAGSGMRPTPQVLVENVADAVTYVALTRETPPSVVIQPWEGLTTASLLCLLGGRAPRSLPMAVAFAFLKILFFVGRRSSKAAGIARRAEMLWLGQDQKPGWLAGRWTAPLGPERWKELA